jgi:hypothetical protein
MASNSKPTVARTAPATPVAALAAAVGAQNADGSAVTANPGTVAAPSPLSVVPAPSPEALAAAALPHKPAGFVPKLARILTLPLLKMKEGEPIYVKFTAPTFIGKKIAEDIEAEKAGKASKEPPVMANVINLATGELVQIMLGKVLNGILADEYPENGYVGKGFVIELTEKKRGRSGGNYNTYKVAELDLS